MTNFLVALTGAMEVGVSVAELKGVIDDPVVAELYPVVRVVG